MEVPVDVQRIAIHMKIFTRVLRVFIGEKKPASKGIKCLLTNIDNYSLEFESLVKSDYSHPTNIMYSVDTMIQRFMSHNKRIKDREDMSKILVNFRILTAMYLS
jgi:hypothetical protein